MLTTVVILLTFTVALWKWFNSALWKTPHLSIPGPKRWPFIGNILQMNYGKAYLVLTDWSKTHGDVVYCRMMDQNWVVASSYKAIHEVFIKKGEDFAGRYEDYKSKVWDENSGGCRGIVGSPDRDPHWRSIRKIVHGSLKQYSTGMDKIESVVSEMIEGSFKDIEKRYCQNGQVQSFNPWMEVQHFATKGMILFVLGERVDDTQDNLYVLIDELVSVMNRAVSVGGFDGKLLDMFPWLRFFGNGTYKNLQVAMRSSNEIWQKIYPKIKARYDPDDQCCVMDHAISGVAENPGIKEGELKRIMQQTISAGIATTTITLYGMLNILANHPNIVKNMQKEIDAVVGSARQVHLQDRPNLPYIRAVVLETLRYESILPLGLSHVALRDTTLTTLDYHIPKGTVTVTNLWAMHHDEAFWGDPWEFRPERFLDADGLLVPADHDTRRRVMPFGAGPRVCIGEMFALARIFLFTASLVQHFDVKPGREEETQPSCDPREYKPGAIAVQKDYTIKLVPR